MRRLLVALAAVFSVAVTATAVAQAQTEPNDPPDPVEIGEDLWVAYVAPVDGSFWATAAAVCPDDVGGMYQAMYDLNAWTDASRAYPGTAVLFHPSDCPPPTSTTTTSTTSTTTTVAPTTSTTTTSTTTTSTTPATSSTSTSSTLPPTTTTPPGSCPAPANTPGGSDGLGGCFPGAHNTGVPDGTVLTNYTGSCTITTANFVIDSKRITCGDLVIRATGVIIRKSLITGQVSTVEGSSPASSVRIEDSTLQGGVCTNCGIDGWNFTLIRMEINGTNRAAYCQNTCTIQDSWIHTAQQLQTNAHASAVRMEQHARLIHNTLHCEYATPSGETGCSADISGYPDFDPIYDNQVIGNLLMSNRDGASYCAYFGNTGGKPFSNHALNATNVIVRDNVFVRGPNRVLSPFQGQPGVCATYGPATAYDRSEPTNQWVNNRYNTGEQVPATAVG